jgi:hypothetical protein
MVPMMDFNYCGAHNPDHHGRSCVLKTGHSSLHKDWDGNTWSSRQPTPPAQISEARTVAEHEMEMRGGVTKAEAQAPTKAEILAAIDSAQFVTASDPTPDEHNAVYLATEGV